MTPNPTAIHDSVSEAERVYCEVMDQVPPECRDEYDLELLRDLAGDFDDD